MKILSVTGPLHKEFGGPPVAATEIAVSLAKLGHQLSLLVCGQSASDEEKNSDLFEKLNQSGAQVTVLRRRAESIYGALLTLAEIKTVIRKIGNVEVVILHQIFELQHVVIFPTLLLMKKPFVIMPHGTLTNYQRRQHRWRKFFFSPATYLFLRSAKKIFVATDLEKSQLPKFLREKGCVVGLGIEKKERVLQDSVNDLSNFTFLYIGRIARKKRLDLALRGFALAAEKSQINMKFIVCGDGDKNEIMKLKALVEELRINSAVQFRGWVDSREKELAFLESDCFILISEDENFAIAAAEALAHGLPCILSSNVALADLVKKHNAGIVVDLLEPLEIEKAISALLIFNRENTKKSTQRAASELSWDIIARKWESTIISIIQS